MIINIHPKELPSKNTLAIIEDLKNKYPEEVVHITDKTPDQWQEIIKSDEPMRFVGPVYWWGFGYELDAWMQNVLTYGFAYVYDNGTPQGLLAGRKFEIHLVHGTPAAYADTMRANITDRLTVGTFGFIQSHVDVMFYEAQHN